MLFLYHPAVTSGDNHSEDSTEYMGWHNNFVDWNDLTIQLVKC